MAATRTEISQWFDQGVEDKKSYMAVVCDDFDYEDYPVYGTREEILALKADPGSMQRVMEIYDLFFIPKEDQMNTQRMWAL